MTPQEKFGLEAAKAWSEIKFMNNEPVAWMDKDTGRLSKVSHNGIPLYTHPAKENTNSYMVEVLNNTLNMERNHNEKAYKELYALCEKLAKENEALKAKTLTDEEIQQAIDGIDWNQSNVLIRFARAILRKASEK